MSLLKVDVLAGILEPLRIYNSSRLYGLIKMGFFLHFSLIHTSIQPHKKLIK